MSKFIDQIKFKMIERHISTEKLSNMIGCPKTSLDTWLNEEEEMPVLVATSITKVLGINEMELRLRERFDRLNDENKVKVLEYIEFLQYSENKLKLTDKTNNS